MEAAGRRDSQKLAIWVKTESTRNLGQSPTWVRPAL